MKTIVLIAALSLSAFSFANDIGAALRTNEVVAGAIQGVEKQYGMKCGHVQNIKSKSGQLSGSITCMNSEEVDGTVLESAVMIQIEATSYSDLLVIEKLTFNLAG